jgi:mono/diheme cytochrome c family protein
MERAAALALAVYATLALADPPAAPWVLSPDELKGVKNPVAEAAQPASAARGAPLYKELCASCHGETGEGDGPDAIYYEPLPPKLKGRRLGDAEVFVKVSKGRGNMKGLEAKVDAGKRWDVVNFVQTLR